MKTLVIVRHAKSSWDNPSHTDFERPLNKRGKNDAPMMAEILKEKDLGIEKIISSPAKRAITTAKVFAEELGFESKEIQREQLIYSEGPRSILNMLKQVDNDINKVIIFGHNPDFTYMASYLSGQQIGNMPTCSMVGIEFEIDSWEKIEDENGNMLFFDYPKKFK